MFTKDVDDWRNRVALQFTVSSSFVLAVLLMCAGADAAQQALLRSSYQSWAGDGRENLERHEPCPLQSLQPFPLPDACFPPGPYHYTTINGVFDVIIHSPIPSNWNDAGREYTNSIYSASDGRFIAEVIGDAYTYSKTLVQDGCAPSKPYNFEIQQCGEPVADKNAGMPLSCPLGNPINQATGNKFHIEVDVKRSVDRGIEFRRVYNFTTADQGFVQNKVLGFGWSGSYLQSIHVYHDDQLSNESVLLKRPDGKQIIFSRQGELWLADADIHSILEELLDSSGVRNGWRFVSEQNTVEIYNALGRLQSISDIRGNVHTLSYEASGKTSYGRLSRVDANSGEYLQFSYDGYGRISSITDHADRQWHYRYSTNNYNSNLQYLDKPDGTGKQYHYEDANFPHALTGITDERGIRYATYAYDAQGRANLSTHAGDVQRVDIVYNADGTRTVTNSLGHASTYTTAAQQGMMLITDISGPGCSTCAGGNTRYNYDPITNNLLSKSENGVTTEYGDYDAKGQYGYRIQAVGTPEQRRLEYSYDERFFHKITRVTEPSVLSGNTRVVTYTYDDFGNRLTATISGYDAEGNQVLRTTNWQYNGPLNQLSLIDGPRTDVDDITTLRYYADDPLEGANRARLREIEDANGVLLRSNIQYSATGKVLSESRPNGLTLTYSYYPGNDRLETLTESDGITSRVTHWSYLATGELQTITIGFGTSEATTFTFGYDDARRLITIGDGLGNYLEYTLDTEGNRIFEKIFDSNGVLKKQLSRSFDVYNRLDNSSQANESLDYDFAPDGTLEVKTDGNKVVAGYSYDTLKRLTQITQDLGGSDPTTANAITEYGYDVRDRLSSVTDPVNGTTRYVYDDLGNLISRVSPDTGTTVFDYDSAGNLAEKIDATGQRFSYSYDALNRLIAVDAPGTADDIVYSHDSCLKGSGRLCGVNRDRASHSYTYTAFGEVATSSQLVNSWPGFQQTDTGLGFSYDAARRLATISYPSGALVSYHYDVTGQITDVDLDQDGKLIRLLRGVTYLPFGPASHQWYGNNLQIYGWYDQAYRPWVIGNVVAYDVLDYDGNGNATEQSLRDGDNTFGYDALNRLNGGSGLFGNREYAYDANGNRTQLTADGLSTHYTYALASNRMTGLAGQTVAIDANGNTTRLREMTLIYSSDNRLRSVTGRADYSYNGLGQRVQKATRAKGRAGRYGFGPKRLFVYGRSGELLVETGPSGQVTREYVYANGTLLAVLDYTPETANDPIFNADMDADGGITIEDYLEWYINHYLTADISREVSGDGVMDTNDANTVWACASVQDNCVAAGYRTSIYYAHNDHLGTPMALTDEEGTKVWSARYDPFGKATVNEDADENGEPVTLNIRFPGQYYDHETELHYNYFRYYDPSNGRYITSDPIGLDGGMNTFGYALDNPLIYFDPFGLACRHTASRGRRCSPGPGRGGGRIGVFGCLIGCVSFMQRDSEAQASMQPTIGGGLSLCSSPREPQLSCEDGKEEDCGIYDPNCDDELNVGVSPPGRAGFGLSVSFNEDGPLCVNLGPHAGLPGPSIGLGGLSE
jgi:RHS repeat-associated protein